MLAAPVTTTNGGKVTTRPRAADDFAVMRARVEELCREHAEVSGDPKGRSPVGPRPYHRAAIGDHTPTQSVPVASFWNTRACSTD